MEIVKAVGNVGFVVGIFAITMAPRIASLILALRRKR